MRKDLLENTIKICRQYDISPARSKGQNFLINEDVYNTIIAAAELSGQDNVLEVGPGLGFLTEKLAEKSGKVVAVELDDKLAALLRKKVETEKMGNVVVVNEDVLKFKIDDLRFKIADEVDSVNLKSEILNLKYKVVANLPYNITSIFLRKYVSEIENKPSMLVLMLQKEVAERIVAKPGKMSILAVSVQFYADAEIVAYVPKQDFWPVPEVDSAVIKITIRKLIPPTPFVKGANDRLPLDKGGWGDLSVDEANFFRLVKFGFSAKRKMLKNNLAGCYKVDTKIVEDWLNKANIPANIRAEGLSVENWIDLLKIVEKYLAN